MKTRLPKNNAVQKQAADPATSVWVEASAGTGKTKILVDRILSLLIHGNQAPNILCLTFTRSAATEMEERLMERLLSWSTISEQELRRDLRSLTTKKSKPDQLRLAQNLYDHFVNTESRPRFHTIHSFCETLLRKFPQEAGVDRNFTILDEQNAKTLLQSARDIVLQQLQVPTSHELKKEVGYISEYANSDNFSSLLDLLIANRWRLGGGILANSSDEISRMISQKLNLSRYTCPNILAATACANSSIDLKGLHSSLHSLQQGSTTDQKRSQTISEWLSASEHERKELFAKYSSAFLTRNQAPIKRLVSAAVLTKDPDVLLALKAEQSRILEFTTKIKRAKIVQCTVALLDLTKKVLAQFSQEKTKQNCLDYDDLITKSRAVLTTAETSSWVLYKIDKTIDHLLIDEAQDTSVEQWEIIQTIASEFFAGEGAGQSPKTIFAVGDYKQSIYSFQNASPESFHKMRDYFHSRANDVSTPWADVSLQISYRSTRPILEAVDLVFEQAFAIPGNEKPRALKHVCWRDKSPGLVELWPILKPNKDPQGTLRPLPTHVSAQRSSRATLAQIIATKINTILLNSSCNQSRTFRPEDIMILVRRRGPFVFDLLKELKNLRIPVTGINRMTLTDNIAVLDLISLGHFLLNPKDDLSLAEVLKSPLCNLDDQDLFNLAHNRSGSLWGSLRETNAPSLVLQEATFLLEDMLEKAKYFKPSELYADLLVTRSYKKFFVSRIGVECIEPLNEFLSKSIEYETKNCPSLQGFIHWLETNVVTTTREPVHNNHNAVKILTVHGAKGLESPIVFLPDTVQKGRSNNPLFWPHLETFPIWIPNATLLDPLTREWALERKKREVEEYHRLLYVAMTRARDQLYICGWSETSNVAEDCWHNMVRHTLENVAQKTSQNIPDGNAENKIPHILRLANFKPKANNISQHGASFTKSRPLPTWVTSHAQNHSQQSSNLRDYTFQMPALFFNSQRPIGELIARLVDSLYLISEPGRELAAEKFASHLYQEQTSDLINFVKDWSLKILQTPELFFLFQDNTRGCISVSGPIKYHQQTSLLHGTIDRLVDSGDSVLLINFLVGNNCHANTPKATQTFMRNIAIKASLAKLLFPSKEIASAILWADEQKLQSLSNDMLEKCLS